LIILIAVPFSASAVLTALEQSNYQQLTSSVEILDFMEKIARSNAAAETVTLAQSALGHPLVALLISSEIHEFMSAKRASDKLTVMLIGSQHGNEPSGAEALMIVSREILEGKLRFHLNNLNFIIIPNSNPDGRSMKRRVNGNSVNLSTNFTVLSEPESRAIMDALHRWQPEVVLDVHESAVYKKKTLARQGYLIDFETQFEAANNTNVDQRIRDLSFHHILPDLLNRLKAQGLPAQRYIGEITTIHQPITHGGLSLRNLRNMAGVLGCFGFLVENRLDPSFGSYPTPGNIKERVKKQCLSIEAFLQSCHDYRRQIISISQQARLGWKHPRNAATLYLSVAYTTDPDRPLISLPLRRLDTGEPIQHTFNYYGMVQSRSPLILPRAYVIRAYQKLFAELLDQHHIAYSTPDSSIPASGEMRPVELPPAAAVCGDSGGTVLTETEDSPTYSYQAGDLLVSLDQPARKLIPLLLEPRSSSSIFNAPEYCRLLLNIGNFLILKTQVFSSIEN
jgi:hypothetical protein